MSNARNHFEFAAILTESGLVKLRNLIEEYQFGLNLSENKLGQLNSLLVTFYYFILKQKISFILRFLVLLTITLTHIVIRGKKSFKTVLKFFMKMVFSKEIRNINRLLEKDMDREQEIKKLDDLITDAESKIVVIVLELQSVSSLLRHVKGHLPRFKEMYN